MKSTGRRSHHGHPSTRISGLVGFLRHSERWRMPLLAGITVALLATVIISSQHQTSSNAHQYAVGAAASTPTVPTKPGGTPISPVKGKKGLVDCNSSNPSPCPNPQMDWISIASTNPSDIIAAMKKSVMYNMELNAHPTAIKGIEAPTMVVPFKAHTGVNYYDNSHFITRSVDGNSKESGTFDFVYDAANHQIAFVSFGMAMGNDPYYATPFPGLAPASSATTMVQSAKGVALRPGTGPELVFFPLDPNLMMTPDHPLQWTGGGYDPTRPIWHIPGADGKEYFVGRDGKAYQESDLPNAK